MWIIYILAGFLIGYIICAIIMAVRIAKKEEKINKLEHQIKLAMVLKFPMNMKLLNG